jgi:type II secretory pathway pseudopilin PulG
MRACGRTDAKGFSIVEIAVALAVILILVGALAPLANKMLNQQREGRTREMAKAAFEGLFGARDRRVANLRADIGFDPNVAGTPDLSVMIVKTGSGGTWTSVRDYAQETATGLFWGYNGPYWSGPANGNLPVDAWGRAFRLDIVGASPNHTWQIRSRGTDGVFGTADDVVYPSAPAHATAHTSVLNVIVNFTAARTGTVVVRSRNATGAAFLTLQYIVAPSAPQNSPYNFAAVTALPTLVYNFPSGGVSVAVTAGATTYYYVVDLMPGEVRDLLVSLP